MSNDALLQGMLSSKAKLLRAVLFAVLLGMAPATADAAGAEAEVACDVLAPNGM